MFLTVSIIIPLKGFAVDKLKVGTIERPPFVLKNNGQLSGFSIELWEAIAKEINVNYQWQEHKQFSDMINAAVSGENDLVIANISLTSAREKLGDFSQPFFKSGMSIAIKNNSQPSYLTIIWQSGIMFFLLGAFGILLIIAHILWFFERNVESARHDYFRDDYLGGIWDAFWWAFIIMTMGGFENEVPKKIVSRILAMIWIIISLFFISAITAQMTTALTVAELQTDIRTYKDLKGKRVAVTAQSSHEVFLASKGIKAIAYASFGLMYKDLKNGKVAAIVADYPVLSYYAANDGSTWMRVVGEVFNEEYYGILFPESSPLLEKVNITLLKLKEEGYYSTLSTKYFGQ